MLLVLELRTAVAPAPDAIDAIDATSTSVLGADTEGPQGRWVSRPRLARLVRAAVVLLPVLAAVLAAAATARFLPDPVSSVDVWTQRAVVVAAAAAVAWASGPLAKRLLPLSALLQLTLVFPDAAPPRMATALRSTSTQELAELVTRTTRDGLPADAARAADDILRLVGALSHHDRITRGHSERVRAYAVLIGQELGLAPERLDALGWAGLLHDIGKLSIDHAILNKPGRLTDHEYEVIKTHAGIGQTMVEPLRGWLGGATDAVGQHHERWDGGGYPQGLRGEEISLEARIMAVADVFDVITAARSYKSPASPAEAREEIARCAGTQFDPEVVRAFLAISVGEFRVSRGPLAVLAQWPIVASITAAGPLPVLGSTTAATMMMTASAASPAFSVYDHLDRVPPAVVAVDEAALDAAGPLDAVATPASTSVLTQTVADSTTTGRQAGATPTATSADPITAPPGASTDPGGAGTPPATPTDDDAYAAAMAAAAAEARADRRAVDAWLAAELAEIDAEHRERTAEAESRFDAATADARGDRDEAEADLAEDRAKRDAKLAEIDEDLADELTKLAEARDADLADVDEDHEDGKLTDEEAEAEREEIRREHDEDVAAAEADAERDRAREREKVAEAERDLEEEYADATREATDRLARTLADSRAERDEDRRKAQDRAAEEHAEIGEDLADRQRKLAKEHGR